MTHPRRPLSEHEALPTLAHLSSTVGHHLINSFSVVVSNAEILRLSGRSGRPVDVNPILDKIIQSSLDASVVARKLIEVSRSLATPTPEPQDLDRIIREAVAEFLASVGRPVDIRVDIDPLPSLPGRAVELRGMFRSLLTNAVEAYDDADATPRVEIRGRRDDRGWIVIEVVDFGGGMPESVLDRALEPFFTTKPDHVGIGLCLAHTIWRRHRGSLALTSRLGGGTRVLLLLNPYTGFEAPGPPPPEAPGG